MRMLLRLLVLILVIFLANPVHAEIAAGQTPLKQPGYTTASPTIFKTPQKILSDFQSSVDRIQHERLELYGELDARKKENAALLQQLNNLSTQLLQLDYSLSKKSAQETQDRNTKVVTLVQEKNGILKNYSDLLIEKKGLENKFTQLTEELQSAKDKAEADLAGLKESLESSKNKIGQEQTTIDSLTQEKYELDQKWQLAVKDKEELESRVKDLNDQLEKNLADAAQKIAVQEKPLRDKIRELSGRLDQAQATLKEKEALAIQFQDKEAQLTDFLAQAGREKSDLQEKLDDLKTKLATAEKNRGDKAAEVQKSLQDKITGLENAFKEKQKDINQLQSQADEATKNFASSENDRAKLNDQIVQLKDDLRTQQSAFEVKIEETKKPLLSQIEDLRRSLNDKAGELHLKTDDAKQLKEMSDGLAKKLAAAEKERNDLRQAVARLQPKADSLPQEIASARQTLQKDLDKLKNDLTASRQELKDKDALVINLNQKQKELSATVDDMTQKKSGLEKMLDDLKAQLRGAEASADAQITSFRKPLEEKITQLQESLDSRNREIHDYQLKNQEIEKSLQSALKDRQKLESDLMTLNGKLKDQDSVLEAKAARAREPLDQMIQKLKDQLAQKAKTVDEKEKSANDLSAQKKDLETLLEKAQAQRDGLKENIVELQKSLAEQKSLLTQATSKSEQPPNDKITALNKNIEEVSRKLKEKENLVIGLNDRNSALDKQVKVLFDNKTKADKTINDLKEELKTLQTEAGRQTVFGQASLKAQLDVARKTIDDNKQALKAKDDLIGALNNQQSDLNKKIAQSTNEATKLRNQAEIFNREKIQLQKGLADVRRSLEEKIDELTKKVSNLEKTAGMLSKDKSRLEASLSDAVKARDNVQKQFEKIHEQNQISKDNAAKQAALVQSSFDVKMAEAASQLKGSIEREKQKAAATDDLNKKIDDLNKTLNDATARKNELERSVLDLNGKTQTLQRSVPDEIAKAQKDLNAKIKTLSEQLQLSQDGAKSKEEVIKGLTQKGEQLSTALNASVVEKGELVKTVGDLKAQLNQSQKSIPVQMALVKKPLEEKVEQLLTDLSGQQKIVKEKDSRITELTKTQNDLDGQLKVLTSRKSELEAQTQQLTKQIIQLQADQSREVSEVKTASVQTTAGMAQKLADAVGEIRAKENLVQQMIDKEQGLEKQLADIKVALSKSEEDLRQKRSELELSRKESVLETSKVQEPLKEKIAALEAQLKTQSLSAGQLKEEKTKVGDDLLRVSKERDGLAQKLKESETAFKKQQDVSAASIAAARQPLEAKIDGLNAQLKEKQALIDESYVEIKQLKEANARLNEQLAQAQKERDDSKAKAQQLQNDLSAKDAAVQEKVSSIAKPLEEKIKEFSAKLGASQAAADGLAKDKNNLERSLKETEVKFAKSQKDFLQKDDALKSVQAQASSELATVKGSTEAKVRELTQKLNLSQKLADGLAESKKGLESSLKEINVKSAQLQAEIAQKSDQLKSVQANISSQLAIAKESAEAKIRELTEKLDLSQKLADGLAESKKNLESSLKEVNAKSAQLQTELTQKSDQLRFVQSGISSQLVAAKKPLEEKIDILVKSLGDVQSQLKIKQENVGSLEAKAAKLEKSLADTMAAKIQLEKDLSQTRSTLEGTRQSVPGQLDGARKPLQEKNTLLQKTIDEQAAQIRVLTADKEKLAKELTVAVADVKKSQQEVGTLKENLNKEQQALNQKIEEAQKPFLAQFQEARKSVEDKESLMKQKGEAFQKLNDEFGDLKKQLAILQEERDALKAAAKMLEAKVKSVPQEIILATRPLDDENARLRVELEKNRGMLDARIKGLEAENESKTKEFAEMMTGQRELESEIVRIMQERSQLSKDNERLLSTVKEKFQSNCGVGMQELQKPWQEKIDELKGQLQSRSMEIEGLKSENVRLNQELGKAPQESPAMK